MDFNFTTEQEQLRDAVRRYIDKSYTFERRCQIISNGGFDRAAYFALAELGLSGLCIEEQFGGSALGNIEAMIVLEELGRGIALEPIAQSLLCASLIQGFAPEHMKASLLPKIADGQLIITLATQERKSRYNLQQCEVVAQEVGSSYMLSGTKNLVTAGDVADAFIVSALLNGEPALFLVNNPNATVTTQNYSLQDGSRAADIRFGINNTAANAQLVTSNGQQALALAQSIGVAHTCAYAVGVLDKTLQATSDYLNTRKQFGQPLANFQVLRHRIADMKMQLELARSMSYFANMMLGGAPKDRDRASSQAKYQFSQSMRFIGQQAVQLHGGIGLTDEYILSHYFKTLTQLEVSFGDGLYHLGRVADLLEEGAGVVA